MSNTTDTTQPAQGDQVLYLDVQYPYHVALSRKGIVRRYPCETGLDAIILADALQARYPDAAIVREGF